MDLLLFDPGKKIITKKINLKKHLLSLKSTNYLIYKYIAINENRNGKKYQFQKMRSPTKDKISITD